MTPIEALDIIHQVRMKYEANGQSHELIREAFRVLKELVDEQRATHDAMTPNEKPKV
jgi:hypothetical protein